MQPEDLIKEKYTTEDLREIMRFLRSEKGCPWDREQDHESIRRNLVEEAYELVDAIDKKNPAMMTEELGDLLLQVVFHSQIAEEKDSFTYDEVVDGICKKLISRHTHLFSKQDRHKDEAGTADEVLDLWTKNKEKERDHKYTFESMEETPAAFPALIRAYKLQKKASKIGFDWDDPEEAGEKIREELEELATASKGPEEEEELGDLLFSVVNYSRFLDIDPELALQRANDKFLKRFKEMELMIEEKEKSIDQLSLEELDFFWDEVKKNEAG